MNAPDPHHDPSPLAASFGPVLLLTFVFFGNFSVRQLVGPLLPAMEAELGMGHQQSGNLVLMLGIGLFTGQLAAAVLNGWKGYKVSITISLWGAAAASFIISLLTSPAALYLAFIVLGMTAGIYSPTGIALVTALVRPPDWGKALSIHEFAPNLALVAAPFIGSAAIAMGSWRSAYLGCAAVLAFMAVVQMVWGKDASHLPVPASMDQIKVATSDVSFWVIALMLSIGVCLETGVYTMVPLFLVNECGFEMARANYILGWSRVPGLLMVLVSGWITDRFSAGTTIAAALGINGMSIVLMAVGPVAWVVPAIFVQGAATAAMFPPILAGISSIVEAKDRSLYLSLSLAITPVFGGGMVPAFIAYVGEMSSFSLGMVVTGVLTLCGIGLVPLLKGKKPS